MKHTKRRRPAVAVAAPVERPEPSARPAPAPARDRRTWLLAVPLVLLVAAAFGPVLGNGFVDWDDDLNFLTNPDYRGLGWPQLKWAWTTFRLGVYQPVAWMLLEAQYALSGLEPRGYHLASLLLHAAVAVSVFALASELLVRCLPETFAARPWARAVGAGTAAALFAVHPMRTEAVAWVSCQPYLPCTLFAALTVLAYLRAVGDGPRRWGWLAASLLFLAAALLSKAAAITLPAVLLILDVYPLRRLGGEPGRWFRPEARKVWLEKLPFFALSLIFTGLAVAARTAVRTLVMREEGGLTARVARACYGVWFYLVETVAPRDLTAFYPLPGRIAWQEPRFAASILATLATTVALVLLRRRWPGLLAAWLAYLVLLAPSSGIVRIGPQLAADRYSYLPMLALLMPAAAGIGLACAALGRAWARPPAVAVLAVAALAVPALAMMARGQCGIWRDSESLWTHVLDHGGEASGPPHIGMGAVRFNQGRLDEAAAHYGEAARLEPGLARAHCGLGVVRDIQGRLDEAAAECLAALRLEPGLAQAHSGLAWARTHQGRFEDAIPEFEEALRLDPGLAQAHCGLASALSARGRYAEALDHYDRAIRLNPDYTEALNDRAMILASGPEPRLRDGRQAVAMATRACERTGWSQPGCLDTLAAAHAEAGDFAAAVARQEQAIALLPDAASRERYRSRLELYRAGKPYRTPPPAPAPSGGRP